MPKEQTDMTVKKLRIPRKWKKAAKRAGFNIHNIDCVIFWTNDYENYAILRKRSRKFPS